MPSRKQVIKPRKDDTAYTDSVWSMDEALLYQLDPKDFPKGPLRRRIQIALNSKKHRTRKEKARLRDKAIIEAFRLNEISYGEEKAAMVVEITNLKAIVAKMKNEMAEAAAAADIDPSLLDLVFKEVWPRYEDHEPSQNLESNLADSIENSGLRSEDMESLTGDDQVESTKGNNETNTNTDSSDEESSSMDYSEEDAKDAIIAQLLQENQMIKEQKHELAVALADERRRNRNCLCNADDYNAYNPPNLDEDSASLYFP